MENLNRENFVESLKQENERLNRAVYELSILNDLAREIGASVNSQDVMQTVISRSLRAVNAEQGVITLSPTGKNGKMKRTDRKKRDITCRHFFIGKPPAVS